MPTTRPTLNRAITSALACLATGWMLMSATAAQAQQYVSIQGSTVNVRATPSTRSATRWELSQGYPLQVLQRKGNWLRVRDHEEPLGWVYASRTSKTPHMVVTAPTANLRSGPGQQHRVVGKLDQHEIVRTLQKTGRWAHVQRDSGQKGWMARSLAWGW